jgi:hypothetical protein
MRTLFNWCCVLACWVPLSGSMWCGSVQDLARSKLSSLSSSFSPSEALELLSFSLAGVAKFGFAKRQMWEYHGCIFVGESDWDRSLPVDLEQLVVDESDAVVFLVILVEFFFE